MCAILGHCAAIHSTRKFYGCRNVSQFICKHCVSGTVQVFVHVKVCHAAVVLCSKRCSFLYDSRSTTFRGWLVKEYRYSLVTGQHCSLSSLQTCRSVSNRGLNTHTDSIAVDQIYLNEQHCSLSIGFL